MPYFSRAPRAFAASERSRHALAPQTESRRFLRYAGREAPLLEGEDRATGGAAVSIAAMKALTPLLPRTGVQHWIVSRRAARVLPTMSAMVLLLKLRVERAISALYWPAL